MLKRTFSILCIYMLCSFTPIDLQAKPSFVNKDSDTKTLQQIETEVIEAQLSELKEQVQSMIFCIQQVEQTIVAHKVKISKKKTEAVMMELQIIRAILQQLYQIVSINDAPEAIGRNSFLIGYIATYLKASLKNTKYISAQEFTKLVEKADAKIETSHKLTLQTIQERIRKNKKSIDQLIKQVETIGLSKTNLKWRRFEGSKTNVYLKKLAKYSALFFIAYHAIIWQLHPETEIFGQRVKNFPRMFGIGKNPENHFIWRNDVFQRNRSRREEYEAAYNRANFQPTPENIKAEADAYERMENPDGISFWDSIGMAVGNIASIPGLLVSLCSPLNPYFRGVWNKAFGLLDTHQDYSQTSKWASEKIKRTLAYLRGETNEKYIGGEFNEEGEEVSLDDIIGQKYLKEIAFELKQLIQYPDRFERAHIKGECGILLYGPPQTGKTMFAKALQTLLKQSIPGERICFIPVTNKDLEQFSVEEMFFLAGQNAPCVLFIDEIEMIGAKRSSAGGQRTRELLTCMNGLSSQSISKNVFVIGATNQPENLDFALTVKGRFGIQIPLSYPIFKDRLEYIKRQFNKRGVQMDEKFMRQFALETSGRSYNALLSVINDAFKRSMTQRRGVTKEDFEIAFDKNIRNILPLTTLTDKEKVVIAHYQVGLAVMRHLLNTDSKTTCLTIRPVKEKIRYNEAAFSFTETNNDKNQNEKLLPKKEHNLTVNGYTFTTESQNKSTFASDDEIRNEILVLLAGQAALEVTTGKTYSHYMPQHKADCINKIKGFLSDGEKNTDDVIKESLELKNKYAQEAVKLLAPYKETIDKLAAILIEEEIIRSDRWNELVQEYFA